MKLEITTPEEHVGDFVSDLQQRRGVITQTSLRGRSTVIEAVVPLSNLFGYSSAMRGLSQGRGSCSMEPAAYGPAPPEVAQSFR
jgi:elongation factor G